MYISTTKYNELVSKIEELDQEVAMHDNLILRLIESNNQVIEHLNIESLEEIETVNDTIN